MSLFSSGIHFCGHVIWFWFFWSCVMRMMLLFRRDSFFHRQDALSLRLVKFSSTSCVRSKVSSPWRAFCFVFSRQMPNPTSKLSKPLGQGTRSSWKSTSAICRSRWIPFSQIFRDFRALLRPFHGGMFCKTDPTLAWTSISIPTTFRAWET